MMKPNVDRRTIAVVVLTLVGAQIPGLMSSPKPVEANACDGIGNAVNRLWNGSTQSYNRQPVDGYHDVKTGKDVPIYADQIEPVTPAVTPSVATAPSVEPMPPSVAAAPRTTPMPPTVAPLPVKQSYRAPEPVYQEPIGETYSDPSIFMTSH